MVGLLLDERNSRLASFLAILTMLAVPHASAAHGFAGKRFFPATLSVDDPFVSDEAGMLLSSRKSPNGDGTSTGIADLALDFAKTITPRFAIMAGTDYLHLKPDGAPAQNGFANTVIGGKYLASLDEEGENLLSLGANLELGGTGAARVGANSASTLSPTLYFGKGMGYLPEALKFLRPIAITGTIAANLAASNLSTQSETAGLTIQYDIHYLQSFVQDLGIGAPFDRMIPLVELPLQTCTLGGCGGQTTGTINPGVIWVGKHYQIGAEATVPLNHASGSHTGVMVQLHFFIDDIYPSSLGRPIFR